MCEVTDGPDGGGGGADRRSQGLNHHRKLLQTYRDAFCLPLSWRD